MTIEILIVGGGATAVAALSSMVDKLQEHNFTDVRFHIADKSGIFGPGLAYGTSVDDHLLNMRASTMSIKPEKEDHFWQWLVSRTRSQGNPLPPSAVTYPTRKLFGEYLKDTLANQCKKADAVGISYKFYQDDIGALSESGQKVIASSKKYGNREYDLGIVCIGNQPPTSYLSLKGTPGYIHDFWKEGMDGIPSTEEVLILGTSLSAIDCYFSLRNKGYEGKVALVSRHGILPKVRPFSSPYTLQFLTPEYLQQKITAKGEKLNLDEMLYLFQQEFLQAEVPFNAFQITNQLVRNSYVETLRKDIDASTKVSQAFSVLKAIDENAGHLWNAMTDEAKKGFDQKYKTLWSAYDYPMPPVTAKKVLQEIEAGKLSLIKGLKNVSFNQKVNEFEIEVSSAVKQDGAISSKKTFRHVINATGGSVDVEKLQEPLLVHGLSSGLFTPHLHGGINIDSATGRVMTEKGTSSRVFLAGSLTRGVHFYTNSVLENAKEAAKIAQACVDKIHNDNNIPPKIGSEFQFKSLCKTTHRSRL